MAAHHRKIANQRRDVANQRRDFAHQLSRRLVNDYDLIVFEDLQIKNMARRPGLAQMEQGVTRPTGPMRKPDSIDLSTTLGGASSLP